MDIHKPKPWHSFREFLKEYLIIVVGVLTALGGEQVVEAARNQREVVETREAIHGEIASNAMYAKVMIAENTCGGAVKAKVLAWLDGGPKPGSGARAMMLPMSSTVWDTAHSKGVANMPMQEQLGLAGYYTGVRLYNDNENRRRDAALRSSSIALLDHPTPEQIGRLREELNGTEIMRAYQISNAHRILDFASSLKIEPRAPLAAGMRANLAQYCRQTGMAMPPL
jgi:hypothetical protein